MENVKRLFDIPYYQADHYPKNDAFAAFKNGEWELYSIQEFLDLVNQASRGLIKMGIQPGDKIAMISNNRPEWNVMDTAILQVGAINVPIYPTISAEMYEYIFNHAEVKLCFVSDNELLEKVREIEDKVPTLQQTFSFDDLEFCSSWKEILEKEERLQEEVEKRKTEIQEDDLATFIYTSGTTGKPKGVMLTHKNIVSNVMGCLDRLPVDHTGKALSFLPVCHVYERMLLYLYQYAGVSIYFAQSLDTIGEDLKAVKPQVFTAVPRLLEKVFDKIMAKGAELSGIKKALFFWAVGLAEQYDVKGKSGFYKFKLSIARKLIFSKWQEALGGNAKAVASGSAALSPRLARIFLAAGVPVMEGYGLTESSPVISVNCEANDGVRIGTVGRVLKNVEVKIAEDGEILAKGPNIMVGYYKDEEQTSKVLSDDGWLHTGDIGEFVEGDFLKITDRKKEIFKTSGGKYIAPQLMENKFKESRFIEQIIVIGEGEKHPAALVVPAFEFIREWGKRKKLELGDNAAIAAHPEVKGRIWQEIQQHNEHFGHWEQIKKIELVPEEWSVETQELTPTLKLKRRVIMDKYKNLVERIYERA